MSAIAKDLWGLVKAGALTQYSTWSHVGVVDPLSYLSILSRPSDHGSKLAYRR